MTALTPSGPVRIPFHGTEVLATVIDGKPHLFLRPVIESLGLDYSTQLAKLKDRSWATVGLSPMVAEDGRVRQMTTLDVRTFLMLLATINENNIADHIRGLLIAFQSDVADVIEHHFTKPQIRIEMSKLEWIEAAREAEMGRLAEIQARELVEAKNATLAPSAEAWDSLAAEGDDFSVREAANVLSRDPLISTGQNRLLATMRGLGWIDRKNAPYQAQVDLGRLVRKISDYTDDDGQRFVTVTPRVTAKGLRDLRKKLLPEKGLRLVQDAS